MLIADDGSGAETAALIEAWTRRLPYPLRHVWHPDEGFRKCRILNQAIARRHAASISSSSTATACRRRTASRCTPRARRTHRYVSGGKVLLERAASARRSTRRRCRAAISIASAGGGWAWRRQRRLVDQPHPRPARRARPQRQAPAGLARRERLDLRPHARAVGGFDERFSYGYEDADFGHRLLLAGVIGLSVRYTAPVYHLDHPRPWRNEPVIAANKALYDANRAARVVRDAVRHLEDARPVSQ